MPYTVTFIATRPDDKVPFFYDAPEHADQMETVEAVLEEINSFDNAVQGYSKTYSKDGLTCTIEIVLKNADLWPVYMNTINFRLPKGIITRNLYFIENGHKLVLTLKDSNGGEISITQVF